MDDVDVVIEDMRWMAVGLEALAREAARVTFEHLELDQDAYGFCVLGCDDARIAALNREFRSRRESTNVLSWPSDQRAPVVEGGDPSFPAGGELGDIAIAFDTCSLEADMQCRPLSHHATHLVVHGLLHLLGYDHADDRNAARMEAIETDILATLDIDGPY